MREFVRESNRIEGIIREPTEREIAAHGQLLGVPTLTVPELEHFVQQTAEAQLRDRFGMDVIVGRHRPPPGGESIRSELGELLWEINDGLLESPYKAHCRYEKLHPFMDGNGRSGRALWAWQMQREGHDPFALPFLHSFYYQALEANFEEPDHAHPWHDRIEPS